MRYKQLITAPYYNRKMQESLVLREVTNMTLKGRGIQKKQTTTDSISDSSNQECSRPALQDLIKLGETEIDFGFCLPGSIHQKTFNISLLKDLDCPTQLSIFIICEDQSLYDTSSLIFGIKKAGQQEFYDDYRIKVKAKKSYEFKIGVKTPMFYEYDVKSVLYISFMDYAPMAVVLKQKVQVPELQCTKELYFQEDRVIKLSTIYNRGKKQCRIPFRMNHQMTISVNAQLIGLPGQNQSASQLDIKPKSMTLSGKGQFSLLVTMNTNRQIQEKLQKGEIHTVRRILVMRIKDTNFMYHYPLEVLYYPDNKKYHLVGSSSMQM